MKVGINVILAVIGLIIAVTMLPTLITSITNANLTGINSTIANFIPLGLIVGCLIYAFASMGGGKK